MQQTDVPGQDREDARVVFVVDDEPGMRSALKRLFKRAGLHVETFASGDDLLHMGRFELASCIVLDLKMPGRSGLEVQAELIARRIDVPTIFLTGAADIPVAVAAMRAGAVDFIEKPFENDVLSARVAAAIERHRLRRQAVEERRDAERRLATLTPREREVLEQMVTGQTSKQIARVLGASHRTIEIHRAHVMEKMAAGSLADLVRMRIAEADVRHD